MTEMSANATIAIILLYKCINVLYTLGSHHVVCQFYLNKREKGKNG